MINFIERYGPLSIGLLAALLLLAFNEKIVGLAAAGLIDISSLYSAMFDWASIQTGFLFGVFGFVSGKSSGFMAEVAKTKAMIDFNRYTRTAILLGFTVTLVSIPLIVTAFHFKAGEPWRYATFVGWAFLTAWSFFSFARVAYVFGVMLKVGDRTRVPG